MTEYWEHLFAVRCMCRITVSSSISIMRTFLKPKLLPAWTRAILDTRVVAQLVKKFCAFYGAPRIIVVLPTVCCWSLFPAGPI